MRHDLRRSIESRKALRSRLHESARRRHARAISERREAGRPGRIAESRTGRRPIGTIAERALRRRRIAEAVERIRKSNLSRLREERINRPFGKRRIDEEELDMELVDDGDGEDLDMELLLGESKTDSNVKQLNEDRRFQNMINKYLNEGKEEDEDEKKVIDEDDEELGDVKGKAKRKALRRLHKPARRRLGERRIARRRICK